MHHTPRRPRACWQAHDHSRGLFAVTLPYTVRSTVERLSLWLNAAPQRRQWV
ncbi:hypothetical protein [Paraburkholderia pallida]|uniref:hypothetical protein n=1 Tax=Paraburkholderia pallida TaxID=2547399 RepID=UPI00142FED03|nr:hypothetical protein [Paraburkholderia pallida]